MRRLFRLAKTHLWTSGTLAATAALAAGLVGCGNDTEGGIEGSTCVSTEEAFAVASFKVLSDNCAECHAEGSVGSVSEFRLLPSSQAGFLDINLATVRKVAGTVTGGEDGKSMLLAKPLNLGDGVPGGIAHEGGKIFDSEDDPGYKELEALVAKLSEPESCPNTEARFLAGIEMEGPSGTARKAALVLGARLLTDEEIAAVDAGGWGAVDSLLNTLLQEDAFYARLMEKYNDVMLTDFYLAEDVDVIQGDEDGEGPGYNPMWWENVSEDPDLIKKYGAQSWDDAREKMASWTQYGIARASIELISYVAKNDKPFTDIVSANYMVVNPFSARAYNITDAKFANDSDPNEFVEARLGGYESDYPHAGFMSDPIWLNRHPTTPTNRNRHRAKEILYMVLGNDILKAAERPVSVDANNLADNPTVNNDQCSVCHKQLDPLAGTFRNFQNTDNDDTQHTFRPDFEWFPEMAQTGFFGTAMPASSKTNGTQWLGGQLAKSPGFAYGAVFMAYRTLTGNDPLQPPTKGSENFDAELTAFLGQYYTFSLIANNFRDGGYNFKSMVKELVMSPYFRAKNTAADIDPGQLKHLTGVGTAHFLTPEQMNRKLENVLGLRWTEDGQYGRANLLNQNGSQGYQILFGGIDSVSNTVRVKEPSGIMANVVERMGLEVGCNVVHAEFSLLPEQRKLLKSVDLTIEPADANGYEVPDAVAAIKTDIQFLHQKLLGERLQVTDPEVNRTYQLFVDVWNQGKADMAGGLVGSQMPGECRVGYNYVSGAQFPADQVWSEDGLYTGRAWSAVMAYMLTDFAFVYEQ